MPQTRSRANSFDLNQLNSIFNLKQQVPDIKELKKFSKDLNLKSTDSIENVVNELTTSNEELIKESTSDTKSSNDKQIQSSSNKKRKLKNRKRKERVNKLIKRELTDSTADQLNEHKSIEATTDDQLTRQDLTKLTENQLKISVQDSTKSTDHQSRSTTASNSIKISNDQFRIAPSNPLKSTKRDLSSSTENNSIFDKFKGRSFKKAKIEKNRSSSEELSGKSYNSMQGEELIESFEQFIKSEDLQKGLCSANIYKPNELQKRILPKLIVQRLDPICLSTLPYNGRKTSILISMLHRINTDVHSPQMVFLTPIPEIVFDLVEAARQMAEFTKINILGLIKTTKIRGKPNHQMIISTHGTFIHHIRNQTIDMKKLKMIYLDESNQFFNCVQNEDRFDSLLRSIRTPFQLIYHMHSYSERCLKIIQHFTPSIIMVNQLKMQDYFDNMLQFYVDCVNMEERLDALINVINNCIRFDKIIINVFGTNACEHLRKRLQLRVDYDIHSFARDLTIEQRKDIFLKFRSAKRGILLVPGHLPSNSLDDSPHMVINYGLQHEVNDMKNDGYLLRIRPALKKSHHQMKPNLPGFVVNLNTDSNYHFTCHPIENEYGIRFIRLDATGKLSKYREPFKESHKPSFDDWD